MVTVDLINDGEQITTDNDSIVIRNFIEGLRGGRTLDVAGYKPDLIRKGHVIIKHTSSGVFKPMPVNILGAINGFGTITGGSSYTNGSYAGVALTGGAGSGATADITVAGGAVTSVTIVNKGTGYRDGDIVSASAANIGVTGSGFSVPVTAVDETGSAYAALPAGHEYAGIMNMTVLTKKPFGAIMTKGTINDLATPYSMTAILTAFKAALPHITVERD